MGDTYNQKNLQPNESGWRIVLGNVDLASAAVTTSDSEGSKPGASQQYFARFFPPMSGISQSIKTGIETGTKYEVGLHVASDSEAGFFAATVSFLNEQGIPVGIPYSTGVKLNSLQPGVYSPVSFVTGPASKGAVQAELALIAVGTAPEKVIDIDRVFFKEAAEAQAGRPRPTDGGCPVVGTPASGYRMR